MQEIVQASHIRSSKGICESNKQLSGQFEDGEGWCQGISLLREVVFKSKICGKKKNLSMLQELLSLQQTERSFQAVIGKIPNRRDN